MTILKKPTFLYVKTHTITGLKYFGKTVKDPITYLGSGTHWKRHILKYGPHLITEILNDGNPYLTKEEISKDAVAFSIKNNIVESPEWANLMIEDGLIGGSFIDGYTDEEYKKLCERNKEIANRPDVKAKKSLISKEIQNRPDVKERKIKNSIITRSDPEHRKQQSIKIKEASKIKITCIHCNKSFPRQVFGRWHGDKCKTKNSIFRTGDGNCQ